MAAKRQIRPTFLRRFLRAAPLPGFALVLVTAIWSVSLHQIEVERRSARNEAMSHSTLIARSLSSNVRSMLRKTDHATHLFKLKFEETGGAHQLPDFMRRQGLLNSVLPLKLQLPIALIDQHGRIIDSANGFKLDNVEQRPYFQALKRSSGDQSLFSVKVVDPATGTWLIRTARRLDDAAGKFAGAVVIMTDPTYFLEDDARLGLSPGDTLILLTHDNKLSVRRSGEHMVWSREVNFIPNANPVTLIEEMVLTKRFDDVERFYSGGPMPDYPLVAVVGLAELAALARFERQRTRYLELTLAASLLILSAVALLIRQNANLHASKRAAQTAQAALRAAADGSLDGVLFLKAFRAADGQVEDFVVVDLNDKGAAMTGVPRAELMGQKLFSRLPQYAKSGLFERYMQVMESDQPLEEETLFAVENEAPRWLYYQIVPLGGGVAVTVRDITERKNAELKIHTDRSFLQSLIDNLPQLISVKSVRPDDFGTIVAWNRAAELITGLDAEQVIGKTDRNAFPPDFPLHGAEREQRMLDNPGLLDLPAAPLHLADGTLRYLRALAVPLLGEDKRVEYILYIAEDVTLRHRQEQQLRSNAAERTAVTDASPLGMVRGTPQGECTYANPKLEALTGLDASQVLGMGWLNAVHPDDRGLLRPAPLHLRKSHAPFEAVVRFRHACGKIVWAAVKIAAVRIDNKVEGYVGTIDDITERRAASQALSESEARLRTIADTLPAMVAYLDADQVYRFHNRAYAREFGRIGMQVQGKSVLQTLGPERYAVLAPYIGRVLAGETVTFEDQDAERTFEVNYIPQLGENEADVIGFHVMRQDISLQKREKKRLLKLAQVDTLTGLLNRAGFLQKLSETMQECAEGELLMGLMYLDIDRFKPVNDTHGHQIGDRLLKAFSARLSHTLRASDTVARLGGDEFTIIMENIARPTDAATIADKVVAAMREPFEFDGVSVSVSTSIGVAFYRDGATSPDELLKQADMLLYQAKRAGRDTYRTAA